MLGARQHWFAAASERFPETVECLDLARDVSEVPEQGEGLSLVLRRICVPTLTDVAGKPRYFQSYDYDEADEADDQILHEPRTGPIVRYESMDTIGGPVVIGVPI
ncbi:hypothetical protein [Streptomyces sp. YIM S03343]